MGLSHVARQATRGLQFCLPGSILGNNTTVLPTTLGLVEVHWVVPLRDTVAWRWWRMQPTISNRRRIRQDS